MFGMLVHAIGQVVVAGIMLTLVQDAGLGALNGLLAGAAVGAVVWTVNKAPDTVGRVMLFTVVLTLLMALVQFLLILSSLPEVSMSGIMAAFQDRSSEMGQMIVRAGNLVGIAALGGAVVAVLFSAPGEAIRGAIIGLFLGALLGAILNIVLIELGIGLSAFMFQFVVALLTWGGLTAVGGS